MSLVTLQSALLEWFAVHGRDLPWRRTRDPYHVLVSEIMLQQTQVDRVIPKYYAFLAQFPTVEALATASTADVIRAWQGLGYNRRAVNLQRAAQALVAAGYPAQPSAFPSTPDSLRELPGIGAYTAGAVACFAFENDVAFLDTNIRRVVRRLMIGPENALPERTERELLTLAESLIPPKRGWDWNQAIMELGALICTAARPQCWRCPVRENCAAYAMWSSADTLLEPVAASPVVRSKKAAEVPFTSSNRFFRGRIIDALRELPPSQVLPLHQLGPLVKDEWTTAELGWLLKLTEALARDGLLSWQDRSTDDPANWTIQLPH